MVGRYLYLHFLLILGVVCCRTTFSATIILSDFDNTVVETRQKMGGTFKTGQRLFKIQHRTSTLEPIPDGPDEIWVSPIDFERIEKYLGADSGVPGAFKKVNLEDGQVIIPGHYMVRTPESFSRFRAATEPRHNYLMEDFKAAEGREPEQGWQGPFWEQMVAILSNRHSAQNFRIITARGHSEADWEALFKYWRRKGYIAHLPIVEHFYNMGLPQFEQYGLGGDVAGQKVNILMEVARRLGRVALGPGDDRLHPNGKESGQYHFVIFADDNQETIEQAVRECQAMVQSRRVPVKFGMFNMGYRSEIIASGRPQYAIIEPGGTFRQATDLERIGEPMAASGMSSVKGSGSCAQQVASGG